MKNTELQNTFKCIIQYQSNSLYSNINPGFYTYRYKNYEYVRTSIKWTLSNWLEDCVQVFTESPYFGYTSGFPKTWLAE